MTSRTYLPALALTLILSASSTAHAAASCPTVVPGASVGPLKLGLTPKQVRKLKLPKDLYAFYYGRDNKKVSGASLDLSNAKCFVLNGKTIRKLKQGPFALAMQIGSCGPMEMRLGGNNIVCEGGKLSLQWNTRHISLRVNGPTDRPKDRVKTLCDAYVGWGQIATKAGKVKSLTIKAGKRYCFSKRMITSKWTPDNIWAIPARSCGEKKLRGQTVLSCDPWGLKFYFKGTLKRIQSYPGKP